MKKFWNLLKSFFSSGKAQEAFDKAAELVIEALPIIDFVAMIASGLTPTKVDDAAYMLIHKNYPQLFDGSITNPAEMKEFMFKAAVDLLKLKVPGVQTKIAQLAVQSAYVGKTA